MMTACDHTRVRRARERDRVAVRALQALLDSPAPDLVGFAFDGPGTALVAERERVVGYALAVEGSQVVYLAELAVAPDARRDGVASALLDALAARFPDREELRATARADDERALAFYRDAGFRRRATLPERYGGTDGVLLARGLGT